MIGEVAVKFLVMEWRKEEQGRIIATPGKLPGNC